MHFFYHKVALRVQLQSNYSL